MGNGKRIIADFSLLLIVLVWGTTFPLMKEVLAELKPLNFIFIRFTIATLVLLAVNYRKLKKLQIDMIKLGVYLGLALAGGFFFQVSGLQFTTASKAGFITGLSVVIVPIIATIYTKKRPSVPVILGIIFAIGGLLLLSYDGNWSFSQGDVLVFFCALSFGLHIFFVGRFVQQQDPVLLTIIQIAVVSIFAGFVGGVRGELQLIYPLEIWEKILYLAVIATGIAFLVQNWAQQYTTSVKTAIIFSLEPVFAMIFAFLLLAEPITTQSLLGGGLIILGMLLAELGDRHRLSKSKGCKGVAIDE